MSLIVQVNVVLNRTVVVDSDQNVSHCQQQQSYSGDYVPPDNQTQPTFEMTPGFKPFTKVLSRSITSVSCLISKALRILFCSLSSSSRLTMATQ